MGHPFVESVIRLPRFFKERAPGTFVRPAIDGDEAGLVVCAPIKFCPDVASTTLE